METTVIDCDEYKKLKDGYNSYMSIQKDIRILLDFSRCGTIPDMADTIIADLKEYHNLKSEYKKVKTELYQINNKLHNLEVDLVIIKEDNALLKKIIEHIIDNT